MHSGKQEIVANQLEVISLSWKHRNYGTSSYQTLSKDKISIYKINFFNTITYSSPQVRSVYAIGINMI